MTKISNAVGRADYVSNPERQEDIVFHSERMMYSWQEHHEYEKSHANADKTNNEAREIIVALPNKLSQDKEELKAVCDDLTFSFLQGKNNDYEYAVHWNHAKTNLHVHIMFSERENATEREAKVYAKDIWQDRNTHKLAKAESPNAELVHRKGEIQRDKDGKIKYKDEPFKAKDKRFTTRAFIQDKNRIISQVLRSHGYELGVQEKGTPYLSQRKEYKGARPDFIENCQKYNSAVKSYNEAVRDHLHLEPQREPTYIAQREKIEKAVKSENRQEQKISPGAITIISRLANVIRNVVNQLLSTIKAKDFTDNFNEMYKREQEPLLKQLQKVTQSEAKRSFSDTFLASAEQNVAARQALLEDARRVKAEQERIKAEEEQKKAEEERKKALEQAERLERERYYSVNDWDIEDDEPEEPSHSKGWDMEL